MLSFHTLDVFTDRPFSGNPLAVVMGADGLTPAQMQTIAREFNLSETIFVMAPQDPANTARVRIFLPTAEIPFAGHPTIGCAIHLAMARHPADAVTHLVLEEEAGLVPVTVTHKGGAVLAELTAPVLPMATGADVPADLAARALGLAEVGFGNHRPGVHQGGPGYINIPLRTLNDLARARPVEPYWSDLTTGAGVPAAFLYTPGTDCDYRSRMYWPQSGVLEDPATGSATAIFAAQLLEAGALTPGTNRLVLRQGVEMGRPSTLHLTVELGPQGLTRVRIAGSAVAVSQGRIAIPAE